MSKKVTVKEQRTAAAQGAKRAVQGTVSSFHVNGEKVLKCVFCSGDYSTAECTVVADVKERKWQLLPPQRKQERRRMFCCRRQEQMLMSSLRIRYQLEFC